MRTLALQAPAMRWQLELRSVSGCSGHADQNRPSASTAGSCICLSNCMSLAAHRHLLHSLCWLAWCSRRTCGVWARSKPRRMRGCSSRHRSCKRAVAAHQARASRAPRAARSCWRAWAVNRAAVSTRYRRKWSRLLRWPPSLCAAALRRHRSCKRAAVVHQAHAARALHAPRR